MDLPRRVDLYARASPDDQDCHLSVETQFIILREHARLDFTQNPGKVMDDITLCVATGGWCRRVFHYRPPTPMYRNSPPLCTIVLQIPSLMPLKMRKVQLRMTACARKPHYA